MGSVCCRGVIKLSELCLYLGLYLFNENPGWCVGTIGVPFNSNKKQGKKKLLLWV